MIRRCLEYLEEKINDTISLEEILKIFEEMCAIPLEDDMILFETGTYSFTGEELFYFSLARQVANEEEEYYQIHVDVLYAPSDVNKKYAGTIWNEDIEGSVFDYIRRSEVYAYAKNEKHKEILIYMDET